MTGLSIDARALPIVDDALELPTGERERFVDERCAGDRPLRERVRRLLGAEGGAWALRTGGFHPDEDEPAPPPDRIGAYRITRLIGQGGMGAVYRGERAGGDFDHVAAIKVVRPGVLSDALVDRFMRERQTLARLAHPNIARLFDGGETADGHPYLVMELVDGVPLDRWLETAPDLAARIRLMLGLCSAVGFAHQNLIVHRDITPSNVLVEADGTPKLIDFGIARPPAAPDAAPESRTRRSLAGLSLTPGFAAPERVAGVAATTLGDIFSLGRLTERVFAGTGDPDLAAIIARATAETPEARYPSASALSADLVRWRDGMPVLARGGGRRYAIAKFVRRHRVGTIAAAAVILALVAALAVTTWSYARAERARQAEAERFDQVRALARFMIFDLNDPLGRVAGNTAARARIAAEAQRYLDALAATPDAPPDLQAETARGLIRLARIQGVPTEPNLGEIKPASANLALAGRLLAAMPPGDPAIAPDRAEVRIYRGLIELHGEAKQALARPDMVTAARILAATPPAARDARWIEVRRRLRRAELELADLSDRRGDIPAIAAAMRRDRADWPAARRASPAVATDEALATYYLALAAASAGRLPQAVAHHLDAERRYDALLAAAPNDPVLLLTAAWNGMDGFAAASQLGREDVSNRLILKARDAIDRLRAIDERDRAAAALSTNIREALAQNLRDQDRFAEAVATESEVIAGRRAAAAQEPNARTLGTLGFSLAVQGVIFKDAGRRDQACQSWSEAERVLAALDRAGTILGFNKAFLPGLRRNLAVCDAGGGIAAFKPLRN